MRVVGAREMLQTQITAARFVATLIGSLVVAWIAGNVVFGILVGGSWVPNALHVILRDRAFDFAIEVFLWMCRVGLFLVLLFFFVEKLKSGPS